MESALIFNFIIASIVVIIFFQDYEQGQKVLKKALSSFSSIFPLLVLTIIFFMGIQAFLTDPHFLPILLQTSPIIAFPLYALFGAVSHIPLFVAFPLMGQLLGKGINAGFIGVYITTLVSVHTFSIPIEIKTMGLKFAVIRNIMALIVAIIIGILIGVIY